MQMLKFPCEIYFSIHLQTSYMDRQLVRCYSN